MAIGGHDGEIKMNIAGNSILSSVLPHLSAALGSADVGPEHVPIMRLDSVADKYLDPNLRIFCQNRHPRL